MTDELALGALDMEALQRSADLLRQASHTVVLAGAGMSKESGVPTFRGEGGLWTTQGEPPLNQYDGFRDDPKRWWERRLEQQRSPDSGFGAALDEAAPNAGHVALVELERIGAVAHVISQNIDDLHHRAGQQSLTEIHGNRHWMRCVGCEARWPREDFPIDEAALPPRCTEPGCDGIVKGDTVMFGEPIPPSALQRSEDETMRADVFMSIGTSAVVYPAAQYPMIAVQRGLPLIEVNPELTPLTEIATEVLRGASGEVLPLLVTAIRERQSN